MIPSERAELTHKAHGARKLLMGRGAMREPNSWVTASLCTRTSKSIVLELCTVRAWGNGCDGLCKCMIWTDDIWECTGLCMCVRMRTLCMYVSKCVCLSLRPCVSVHVGDRWVYMCWHVNGHVSCVSKYMRIITWVCVGECERERCVFRDCLYVSMCVVWGHAQTVAHLLSPSQWDNEVCTCQLSGTPIKNTSSSSWSRFYTLLKARVPSRFMRWNVIQVSSRGTTSIKLLGCSKCGSDRWEATWVVSTHR